MQATPPPATSTTQKLRCRQYDEVSIAARFRFISTDITRLLLLMMFTAQCMLSFSQAQNRAWVIPDQQLLFNPAPTVSSLINYAGSPGYYSHNAMQDANGNLLFYIIDGDIWDKDGNWIDYIINPYVGNDAIKGWPEVCIVPVPDNCMQYFIIAAGPTYLGVGSTPATFWVTLDLSLPNPNNSNLSMGALVGPNPTMIPPLNHNVHANSMHIGVTKLRPSTNDRILFITDNSEIHSHFVSASGISSVVKSDALINGNNSAPLMSELEIYEFDDHYIVASVGKNSTDRFADFYYYDFSATLFATSSVLISSASGAEPHGIEFSPNGQYLYVTNTVSPFIQYIDIANSTIHDLTQATTASDFQDSQIELGYDGKLYFAARNPDRLASLAGSDNPGTATWDDQAVSLTLPPSSGFSIHILPDQIDGEVYGTTSNSTPECCDFSQSWEKVNYTANAQTETWEPGQNPINGGTGVNGYIKETLTIPAGADITIKGMTLRFGLEGKIRIEKGGKLTVSESVLSGNDICETMWQGIEVLGVGLTNGSSDLSDQGQFISDNSTIEQAITGIINGSFNTSNTSFYGGYFYCTQTTFTNCRFGIKMWSHNENADYTCIINSCVFTGSALWYPYTSIRPVEHVALVDVTGGASPTTGVDIVFDDTPNRNTFNNADYGLGILDTRNILLQRADFTNCGSGIWAGRATSSSPTASIFTSLTFEDCHNSITLINSNGDDISDNVMNAGYGSQNTNFYGVFIEGADDFHITDNIFNRIKIGVWSSNSGSVGGMISSNTGGNVFNECWRAIDCRNNNENLQIKCNTFNNASQPDSEFSTAWYVGGDLPDQGSDGCSSCPAGNEFFRSGARKDIYSLAGVSSSVCTGKNFCYYRHSNPTSVIPLLYTPATVDVSNTIFNKISTSCTGQGIMAMSGNDPGSAKGMIAQEQSKAKQQLLINELLSWYRSQNNLTDAVSYLETLNTSAAKELLFDHYLDEKEYNKAQGILNARCAQNDDESMAYCKLNTLVLNWARGSSSPYNMSRTDKATLASLATGFTGSSGQAQAILRRVFDEITGADYSGDSTRARMTKPDEVFTGLSHFALYPNPANEGVLFVSANMPGLKDARAAIKVYDLTGKRRLDVERRLNDDVPISINLEGLGSGIYFMELQLDGFPAQFQKLIIE